MKVGDLVEPCCPTTRQVGKVFLVTDWRINWIKVLGSCDWQRIADFEVVNETENECSIHYLSIMIMIEANPILHYWNL